MSNSENSSEYCSESDKEGIGSFRESFQGKKVELF